MKKRIVLLALSTITMLSLSFIINTINIAEDELPRPTAISSFI
ncbi:hypothetical protein ACFVR1_03915 [Psychrobacillus sp. NPDC058041]